MSGEDCISPRLLVQRRLVNLPPNSSSDAAEATCHVRTEGSPRQSRSSQGIPRPFAGRKGVVVYVREHGALSFRHVCLQERKEGCRRKGRLPRGGDSRVKGPISVLVCRRNACWLRVHAPWKVPSALRRHNQPHRQRRDPVSAAIAQEHRH